MRVPSRGCPINKQFYVEAEHLSNEELTQRITKYDQYKKERLKMGRIRGFVYDTFVGPPSILGQGEAGFQEDAYLVAREVLKEKLEKSRKT